MLESPSLSIQEARARDTFLALMWAFSYPGQPADLPLVANTLPHNFIAIGESLLDLETSFHSPNEVLTKELKRTGAAEDTAARANYLFYPRLTPAHMADIGQASRGTMLYPDQSATLIIGCRFGRGTPLKLEGPGIAHRRTIIVGDIPSEFWKLRQKQLAFPLGWDIVLVFRAAVIGLPRTTTITLPT